MTLPVLTRLIGIVVAYVAAYQLGGWLALLVVGGLYFTSLGYYWEWRLHALARGGAR